MSIDKEILIDFVAESKDLIKPLPELLESIEEDLSNSESLINYGNKVDRVMGGAQSLALSLPPNHPIVSIGHYAALCKAVSYKASQIDKNQQFYSVCVALLLDATEYLMAILEEFEKNPDNVQVQLSETFLERLRWLSSQFPDHISATVQSRSTPSQVSDQIEIDAILNQMGVNERK